ncbi:unnamed protein product [Cuscuta epithymum]|uniref:G protein gamma domain-containing protein n=1 Tax=Cuscuta epithymum TaxID=186058 RepID=A0AAV0GLN5_9ASTE|nr:unnamed protein product [Cuscuta epithymum]CAH9148475.1 unnamed protein product [Cuscuta epithymum]
MESSEQQMRSVADTRGKHRISAELKQLEQEARFLEEVLENGEKENRSDNSEELEQVDKMDKASAVCKELLVNTQTRPDPLLPETTGPTSPLWDRWFERPPDASSCRCWIL